MKLVLILSAMLGGASLFAQTYTTQDTIDTPFWIDMMQDPDANFFETQRAFELYWSNKPVTKGSGWKPFKRWENRMLAQVNAQGDKPKGSEVQAALQLNNFYRSKESVSGNWSELGPISLPNNGTGQPNGLGRINGVAFHPTDANTIYAGAPAGGVWKTTNGGGTWSTSTDQLATMGVSCILVNHTNPDTVYFGSGDRDGSDAPGLGVYLSTDAGATWNNSSSGMGNRVVGDMLMHPSNTQIIIAATNNGIYRSTNGGANWTKTSSTANFKDLEFKPGDPNTVYATASGDFYKSTDNGQSWSQITSGIGGSHYRLVIGVTPANPDYVYLTATAFRVFEALYRSTNSGTSFSTRSTTPNIMDYAANGSGSGGQSYYDLAMAVDRSNANILYVAGINIWKSTDGGVNWTLVAHWTGSGGADDVHADHHCLAINPLNNRVYNGNDGGLYYTADGGNNWIDISSGMAIAQVYKIGQSATVRDLVINGYQDNGTAIYSSSGWDTEIGGDGMECIIDYQDPTYIYGALYYGDIRRSSNGGNNFTGIAGDGVNNINESGAWVTPYILHESNPNTMFAGYKNVWRTTDVRGTAQWTVISNNLGGTNSVNMRVLENSPADVDILYAARANSLFRTDNANAGSPAWTDLTANLPSGSTINDIEAHPSNPNIVYIVIGSGIYQSMDKGVSWKNITGALPGSTINCVVYDSSSTDSSLYVGLDVGCYYKNSNLTNWIAFATGMPSYPLITELEIWYGPSPSQSVIRAATYSRGLWSSDLFSNPTIAPTAKFQASETSPCLGQTVQFTDKSTEFPTSWQWSVVPATVTFTGGTSATDQNPQIQFNSAGVYTVSLGTCNGIGCDTLDQIYTVTSGTEITVRVTTDQYPDEVSWVIKNPGGTVVLSGGPWPADSGTHYATLGCLPDGCYDFVIYDNGADGICCAFGNGDYSVYDVYGNELAAGGAFGLKDSTRFCLPAPVCANIIDIYPYQESFESNTLGDWRQAPNDSTNWTVMTGGTPSGNTGPASAYDGNFYTYVEASAPNYPSKEAGLFSPCFDLSGLASAELSFAWHMWGADMGTLNLDVSIDGMNWTNVWTRSGDQGNSWQTSTVSLNTWVGDTIQLRFWGTTGVWYRGDMSIDKLFLSDPSSPCTPITSFPYNEGFENGNTGVWVQDNTDDIDWTVTNAGTPSPNTGPSAAHAGAFYAHVEASTPNYPSKVARLEGPCLDLSKINNPRISFAWHKWGFAMGTTDLQITTDLSNWTTIWTQTGDQGNQWHHDTVSLQAYAGDTVALRWVGTTGNDYASDMSIDDISVFHLSLPLDCSNALALSCAQAVGSSTTGANSNVASYNCGRDASGPELVHTFTVTTTTDLTATLSNLSADLDVYLLDACNASSCVAFGDQTLTATGVTPGTYYIVVEGYNGASGNYTLEVSATAPVVQVTTNKATICDGVEQATLTATGAATYSWSPSTGLSATTGAQVNASPSGATLYTVTGSSNGCTNSATVNVDVNPQPTVSVNPASAVVCTGDNQVLTASGAGTYMWSPSTDLNTTTGPVVTTTPTANRTYQLIGTIGICHDTVDVPITVLAPPTVTVTPASANLCEGDSVSLTAAGASTYAWFPTATLSASSGSQVEAFPTNTQIYEVIGQNGTCADTTTVQVTVVPVPTVAVSPTSATVCDGDATPLMASGASTYTWLPVSGLDMTTGPNVNASPSVSTIYTVTGTQNGCTATATSTITVNPLPTITINPGNPEICDGQSIGLTATGATTYDWSPGNGLSATTGSNVQANPAATQTYVVTGTDANGCVNTGTVTVTVHGMPTVVANVDFNAGTTGQTFNFDNTGSNATTYDWDFDDGNVDNGPVVSHAYTQTGVYTVVLTGTDPTQCAAQDSVVITVDSASAIHPIGGWSFSVFPNPARDEVSVKLTGMAGPAQVTLLNDLGQIITTSNSTDGLVTFNLAQLPAGQYMIQVSKGEQSISSTLVKGR